MTDFRQMILDFLKENPDYMLVSGWVLDRVCLEKVARPKSELLPQGGKESEWIPLFGPLSVVDKQELAHELYLLKTEKKLLCEIIEDRGCTCEMRYTLPPDEKLVLNAAA